MARKTHRRLKLSQVGISVEAMQILLSGGGEDIALRAVRVVQREWARRERPEGFLNVLKLGGVTAVWPLGGEVEAAILSPEEADRTRNAITSGKPDQITLHRVGLA